MLTALLVIFTATMAFFIWRQWAAMRNALHADTLLRLREAWESKEMIEARRAVWDYKEASTLTETIKETDRNNAYLYFILTQVAFFFEDVGLLVERGYVREKDVMELLAPSIVAYYEMYKPLIEKEGKPPAAPRDAGYFFYYLCKKARGGT